MNLMRADGGCGLVAVPPPELPVSRLVLGKTVEEAVELLPRIFNLCREAQAAAMRLACGLPMQLDEARGLRRAIARDHRLRLSVILPRQLGLAGGEPAVITPGMRLAQACATAPLLEAIRNRFAAGEAVVEAVERHALAARQAHHPLMEEIADTFGRGPLWRVAARFLELTTPDLPAPRLVRGWAEVPASRGLYRVRAQVQDGRLAGFERRTPTDEMLAPGGAIAQSLATLPRARAGLASLVLDILDPCVPVQLKEAEHA